MSTEAEFCRDDTVLLLRTLRRFGLLPKIVSRKVFLSAASGAWCKHIVGVITANGRQLVLKFFHEDKNLLEEQQKGERQSRLSELYRRHGIQTPKKYSAEGQYCLLDFFEQRVFCVTVEDWCGEELRYIDASLAERIGMLLAHMHRISLQTGFTVGCGTLFGAAVKNDVDAFEAFCTLCEDTRLDTEAVAEIKALREQHYAAICAVWDTLPRGATQGDISVNNLTETQGKLTVFDYNNAGDEVLVSDLVLEGLLTAYEMDLPDGAPDSAREAFFPAFVRGYQSVRPLSEAEQRAAWDIYVLYDSLWFTKILHRENSLSAFLQRGEVDAANARLRKMLSDLMRQNDGMFRIHFSAETKQRKEKPDR